VLPLWAWVRAAAPPALAAALLGDVLSGLRVSCETRRGLFSGAGGDEELEPSSDDEALAQALCLEALQVPAPPLPLPFPLPRPLL
jgi:hypothetical protein